MVATTSSAVSPRPSMSDVFVSSRLPSGAWRLAARSTCSDCVRWRGRAARHGWRSDTARMRWLDGAD
eukprot:5021938-Prymnesium_polylepis.1